jgi:hypothetical protein
MKKFLVLLMLLCCGPALSQNHYEPITTEKVNCTAEPVFSNGNIANYELQQLQQPLVNIANTSIPQSNNFLKKIGGFFVNPLSGVNWNIVSQNIPDFSSFKFPEYHSYTATPLGNGMYTINGY